jgi:hypothetical protein
MTLYKVTGEHGESWHGGSGKWVKNRWRTVSGEIIPCENGLHLCRPQDLIAWLGPVIWEAEVEGDLVEADDKVIAAKARVVRRIENWNERTARLFAADCAERVLPIFEKHQPNDDRPRKAIESARAFANGKVDRKALAAARAAAWAAADAAGAAARAAARAAAWAAADAAWDAAGAAADAAWAAAWAAAWDAAGAAAWAPFGKWATDRLFDYLEGRAG